MADILSLSSARKVRARAAKEAKAAENRVKFGRSKADKQREAAEQALVARTSDAHRRDDDRRE